MNVQLILAQTLAALETGGAATAVLETVRQAFGQIGPDMRMADRVAILEQTGVYDLLLQHERLVGRLSHPLFIDREIRDDQILRAADGTKKNEPEAAAKRPKPVTYNKASMTYAPMADEALQAFAERRIGALNLLIQDQIRLVPTSKRDRVRTRVARVGREADRTLDWFDRPLQPRAEVRALRDELRKRGFEELAARLEKAHLRHLLAALAVKYFEASSR